MSYFVYETEDGEVEEREFAIGTAPHSIRIAGKTAQRSFTKEHPSLVELRGSAPGGYPKDSFAISVHPKQVSDMERKCAAAGVPTTFNKRTGDAVIISRSHQKKLMKALNMYDRAAWY